MHPKLTGEAYDEITHLWESDSFNRENGVGAHRISLSFIEGSGKALDVGCGCNSRLMELLISSGFEYEGLDVSEKTISIIKNRNPDITFHHADICDWKNSQQYDFITAWDSIWHVPLNEQEQVLRKLTSALNKGGVLLFSFGGMEEASEHTNNEMGPTVYYATLGTNRYLKLLTQLGCIIRHLEYDQYPESHAYIIVQKLV